MLALWPDHIYVIISPDRIALLQTRRQLFKCSVVAELTIDLPFIEKNYDDSPLIIEKLTALLSKVTLQRGNLDILLSNHFVQMDLLPPLNKALKPNEQIKRAQLHFERVYGVMAKKWSFISNPLKFQQPTLVAAIDQALLSGLQNLASKHNLKLTSVEPSVMLMLNHWKKRLNGAQMRFVSVEKTCLNIIQIDNLKITSLFHSRYKDQLNSEYFLTLIQREAFQNGETLQGKELYLFAPKNPSLTLDSSGAKLHHLRLPVIDPSDTRFTQTRILKLLGEM